MDRVRGLFQRTSRETPDRACDLDGFGCGENDHIQKAIVVADAGMDRDKWPDDRTTIRDEHERRFALHCGAVDRHGEANRRLENRLGGALEVSDPTEVTFESL